jgi:arylsulfatase A-like enzyme
MPAPHTPWLPTPAYKGKTQVGDYGDYVAMVDDAVGEILKTVEKMGFSKNTIIIFTSDNGPYWRENFVKQYNHASAGVFRGMKGDAFEGGHRVPFIVKYPNHVKPGSESKATTTLANLFSTAEDIIGIHSNKNKPEDSYSILPILLGKSSVVENQPAIVNISSIGFYSIRKGPWKLITKLGSGGFTVPKEITPKAGEPIGQLYNLDSDIHEDNNLYQQYPEKVKELTELLEKIKNLKK